MKIQVEPGDPMTEQVAKIVFQASLLYGEEFAQWIIDNLHEVYELYKKSYD